MQTLDSRAETEAPAADAERNLALCDGSMDVMQILSTKRLWIALMQTLNHRVTRGASN